MPGYERHLFAGGNTAFGFHSFFEHVIPTNPHRVWVIKGGPGVGKSRLMQSIGEVMQRQRHVEYFHCSSGPQSLDGLVIPELGVAFLDGTSPHVVDPKFPGAVDEIVNLGEYWQQAALQANRAQIQAVTTEISRLFRRTYGYLACAKKHLDEHAAYHVDARALDWAALKTLALRYEELLLPRGVAKRAFTARHLFASAITPSGFVNFIESLMRRCQRVLVLQAAKGAGAEYILDHLQRALAARSLWTEVYHCGLDPETVEHLYVPELSLAVVTSRAPHVYTATGTWTEDLNALVREERLTPWRGEMTAVLADGKRALEKAVGFLERAKLAHDELESFYVPNMDFSRVEARRAQILAQLTT